MRIENYNYYELNVKHTLYANIIYMCFMFVVLVFIFKSASFIGDIQNENTALIAIIVFMFITLKLLGMVGVPNLEYQPRKIKVIPEPKKDKIKSSKSKKKNGK